MTDKELRKLKRADLIEILYYLKRENEELTEENEKLRSRLDALVGEAIQIKNEQRAEDEKSETEEQVSEKENG